MAKSFNKVILVGNLVKDPEQEVFTKTGKKVLRIRIAVNDSYKNSESTYFFDVVVWEGLVDVIKNYTKKGTKILVEGRLTQRSWISRDEKGNEVRRSTVEILAENVLLLSPKGETKIEEANKFVDSRKEIEKKEGKYENFLTEPEEEGETFEDFGDEVLQEEEYSEEINENEIDYSKIDEEEIEDINTDEEFKI